MGKYTSSAIKRKPPKTNEPHYIWQGLGCLISILVAVISMAAGQLTVDYLIKNKFEIPAEMLGSPTLPNLVTRSSGLTSLFGWITQIDNFYAVALATLVFMILIGGFASLLYTFAYRFVAPPRYGPQDIPPPNFKVKKFKR